MVKLNDIVDNKVVKVFGDDYVKILTENLLRAGKEASGKLIKSLNWRMVSTADAIQVVIDAEDYLIYVDKGRRPGVKPPPISALKSWCKIKGIDEGAAWPIQKSIFKFGIPPTGVIEKSTRMALKGPFVGLDIISDNIEKKFFELLVKGEEEIKRIKK